jgi:hypothetical protein
LQDRTAPVIIGESPLLDLFQGTEAAQAVEVIAQTAISDAGGLSRSEVIHGLGDGLRGTEFDHTGALNFPVMPHSGASLPEAGWILTRNSGRDSLIE